MSTNIYILKLAKGKYYVGKSENPMKRYHDHLQGKGSSWTRKYKPIAIDKILKNQDSFEEDKQVKMYMNKYGIENVRGGSYVSDTLPAYQKEALIKELRGATDQCTVCGRKGHWAKDCFAKTDTDGNDLSGSSSEEELIQCIDCNRMFDSELKFENHSCSKPKQIKTVYCYRCKRQGHYAPKCYARTDKYGNELDD
jgi:predicted GIY-YIG superfamily endonuclease